MDRLIYLTGTTLTVRDGMEARGVTPEEANAIREALPGEERLPLWLDAGVVLAGVCALELVVRAVQSSGVKP